MSTTTTVSQSPTFSMGVWKSVYLVTLPDNGAAVSHVVPKTFYRGTHPVTPLVEGAHAGFDVEVDVHLLAAHPPTTGGTVKIVGGWGAGKHTEASAAAPPASKWTPVWVPSSPPSSGDSGRATGHAAVQLVSAVVTVRVVANAEDVDLWWPSGMGKQPLYDLSATFTPPAVAVEASSPPVVHSVGRRVGFREFALVTINDTDPLVRLKHPTFIATLSLPS
jgi:hypothetical protein